MAIRGIALVLVASFGVVNVARAEPGDAPALGQRVDALERDAARQASETKARDSTRVERADADREEFRRDREELRKDREELRAKLLSVERRINDVEANALAKLVSMFGVLGALVGLLGSFGLYKLLEAVVTERVSAKIIERAEKHTEEAIKAEKEDAAIELLVARIALFQRLAAETWDWYRVLQQDDPQKKALVRFASNLAQQAYLTSQKLDSKGLKGKHLTWVLESRSQYVYHRVELHRMQSPAAKDYAADILDEGRAVYRKALEVKDDPDCARQWFFWAETYAWACLHAPAPDSRASALEVARQLYCTDGVPEDFKERLVSNYFGGQKP